MVSLARFSFRHRWLMVGLWLAILIGLGGAARAAGDDFRFEANLPDTPSATALNLIGDHFPAQSGESFQIVWQTHGDATVTDPEVTKTVTDVLDRLATQDTGVPVASITSPYTPGLPPAALAQFVSPDKTVAYATVILDGPATEIASRDIKQMVADVRDASTDTVDIAVGGSLASRGNPPINGLAETLGLAAAAVFLFIAFGSLLAMLLPLGTAVLALGAATSGVILASHVFAIPSFATALTALIGLGVGIDYALFLVSRHRLNLQRGIPLEESVIKAFDTSGRAVVFAAITVMIALGGLFIAGLSIINGLAVAAMFGVLFTMLVTITLLPALLSFTGMRVLSRKERRDLAVNGPHDENLSTGWMRWSQRVARRPIAFTIAALVIIGVLAAPAVSIRLGVADSGNAAPASSEKVAYDMLADGFGPGFNGPLLLAVDLAAATDPAGTQAALGSLIAAVTDTDGVVAVTPPQISQDNQAALFTVIPSSSPQDAATSDLIATLRTDVIPDWQASGPDEDLPAHVGGATAIYDDFADVLAAKIPLFLLTVIVLSTLLLILAFRSLLVPLTGAVMNLLTAAAAFGVVAAVFQHGWGASLIGVSPAPIDPFMPIMLLAILFGLSMDYQVFLVSRMREEWVVTGDNKEAVTRGLAETARVITAAATIMVVVFASFVFTGDRTIKIFGVGLAVAIILDAVVVRTMLVPAVMHLLGKWNWWIPAWLDRILPNVTIEPSDFAAEEAEQDHRLDAAHHPR